MLLHPRKIGWLGTTALAMGGSNQSLFIISALFVGQGAIPGQGSAAIPLLVIGLLLSLAAAPGWLELVLMSPNRVGGISAACAEAFRPYGQILSALTTVCYWWGWIPTCGVTAIFSASAIHDWYLPQIPVWTLACALVSFFTAVNLLGIKWVTYLAIPIATLSALLAFLSSLIPLLSGQVNWTQAFNFQLTLPFDGWFGQLTSLMAGLYLIGFAAPAFEAALCHVGETKEPNKNVPRAMWASALMATLYFAVLPLIWHGTIGDAAIGRDLALELGPTFAPLFGSFSKALAIWFIMFNMFHGTLQPLAGAARSLSQLSEDGQAPRFLAKRLSNDVPWIATLVTAGFAIAFLLIGDPIWLIAAANFTYLISIGMPSIAVWLLRNNQPQADRPYRAPRGTIILGLVAAGVWGISTVLGFQQFGLPTVVISLAMAYSGALIFAWRRFEDRRLQGLSGFAPTLHTRLTGAMLMVLVLDGAGYILAVGQIPHAHNALLVTVLSDIFVLVAILTITVGIVLPGMIAHSAEQISTAAAQLAQGTLKNFSTALLLLGKGNVEKTFEMDVITPIVVRSQDELGVMADRFNDMQQEIRRAAIGLDEARINLSESQSLLVNINQALQKTIEEQQILTNELAIIATAFDSQEALIITDASRRILKVNHAFTQITGYYLEEVIGQTPDFSRSGLNDEAFYLQKWKTIYSYHFWRGEVWNKRKNNEIYPERLAITAVCDAKGHVINYVYSFSDDSQHKKTEAEIHNLAFYDFLTKLPNRRLLTDRLRSAVSNGNHHNNYGAVLFIDLDNFKTLNDTKGHEIGDQLLIEVAKRLRNHVRDTDTAGRLGGDEFVVLLNDLSEDLELAAQQAGQMAEKISISINIDFDLRGIKFHTSPSIGISLFQGGQISSDEVLKRADAAMYLAKNAGRNTTRLYDPIMQTVLESRVQLEAWMRNALLEQQYLLFYQLQVDQYGAPSGAEVLLRWQHPEKGMIYPNEFITLAEQNGLIVPIGLWVLETACAQLKAWQTHPQYAALQLSVNVSARQFSQPDFVEKVQHTIVSSGIDPGKLKLEITESLVLTDVVDTITKMHKIKQMGIGFSIDDFGTGQSSLAYLTQLPIEQLKIDQSFVRDIHIASSAVMVRTIIGMAHNLGLHVIAEGVETAEQRHFLQQNGCNAYQGFYFSQPLPLGQFELLLHDYFADSASVVRY